MALTYSELSSLLHQISDEFERDHHFTYDFFYNNLLPERKFFTDITKALGESELLNFIDNENNHEIITPEINLYELLWYVYLLPWEKAGVASLPDYRTDDIYEKFIFKGIQRKKLYYLGGLTEKENADGIKESYCAKINITQYAKRIQNTINSQSETNLMIDDIVCNIKNKIIMKWSVTRGGKASFYSGEPLLEFPLISELSIAVKRSFFILDLCYALFQRLTELVEDAPIMVPKEILTNNIVGFSKSQVSADVTFNEDSETIELRNNTYHTIFDVISVATGDNDVETAIEEIKKENRTFANITTKDFAGLSNLLQEFSYGAESSNIKDTSVGELTDIILNGIASDRLLEHRTEAIIAALDILQKWSTYAFEFDTIGRLTLFNYVAGEYADPKALANAIRDGKVKLTAGNTSSQSLRAIASSDFSVDAIKNIEDIPVRIEISNLFRTSVQGFQMSRQFSDFIRLLPPSKTETTRYVYTVLELKRKEEGYPSKIILSYKELANKYFVVNDKKIRFLKQIDKSLDELKQIGAIKDYSYIEQTSVYIIEFADLP